MWWPLDAMNFCLSYKAQWTKFNFETNDALLPHNDMEKQLLAPKRITDGQRESSQQNKKGNIDILILYLTSQIHEAILWVWMDSLILNLYPCTLYSII